MTKRLRRITLPRSVKRLFPQVETAVDSNKNVEVSVLPRDCKEGKSFDPAECALARAAKRELKVDGVIIGLTSSYLIKGTQAVRFDTPESVQREIVSFDRHQDFAPGEYYLRPKAPTTRFGSGPRKRKGKHSPTTPPKRKIHHSARVRVLDKGSE